MLNSDCAALLSDQTKFHDLLNELHHDTMKNLLTDWESDTKISLAVNELTTSNKKLAFLEIICYYITEDWKYWECLIEFESVKDSYTDQNLEEIVKRVLIKNDLQSHLLVITTDNASNNDILQKELAEALDHLHDVNWNKECEIISCLAHVF